MSKDQFWKINSFFHTKRQKDFPDFSRLDNDQTFFHVFHTAQEPLMMDLANYIYKLRYSKSEDLGIIGFQLFFKLSNAGIESFVFVLTVSEVFLDQQEPFFEFLSQEGSAVFTN